MWIVADRSQDNETCRSDAWGSAGAVLHSPASHRPQSSPTRLAGPFSRPRSLRDLHTAAGSCSNPFYPVDNCDPVTRAATHGMRRTRASAARGGSRTKKFGSARVPPLIAAVLRITTHEGTEMAAGFSGSAFASWEKSGDTCRLAPLPLNSSLPAFEQGTSL